MKIKIDPFVKVLCLFFGFVNTSYVSQGQDFNRIFSYGGELLPNSSVKGAADFNGDGFVDLLVTGGGIPVTISWLKNFGHDGLLDTARIITDQHEGAKEVGIGDFDGDGDLDILTLGYDFLTWHANDGSGNFLTGQRTPALGNVSNYVAVGDLDDDGDADYVVTSVTEGLIAWYENFNGLGFFVPHSISIAGTGFSAVELADLDQDNDLDIIVTEAETISVSWFENLGSGSFSGRNEIRSGGFSMSPYLKIGDIDLDGDSDITFIYGPSQTSSFVGFLINEDSATSFADRYLDLNYNSFFDLSDVDIDGDLDITTNVGWFENQNAFNSQPPKRTVLGSLGGHFPIDIDHDGDVDLFNNVTQQNWVWYRNLIRPAVDSITIIDSLLPIEEGDTLYFWVKFEADVINVDEADFVTSGSAIGTVLHTISYSDKLYQVIVTQVAGIGPITLDIAANNNILSKSSNLSISGEVKYFESYWVGPGGDGVGNGGDTIPPTVTVDWLYFNSHSPNLTGKVNDHTATLVALVDGQSYELPIAEDCSWMLPPEANCILDEGEYLVQLVATDATGNQSITEVTLHIDFTPPTGRINRLTTADRSPELTGRVSEDAATVILTIPASPHNREYQPNVRVSRFWELFDNQVIPLEEGTYDVVLTITDLAGNVGYDTSRSELTISYATPTITIQDILTNQTSPELTGSVSPQSASVTIFVDGQTWPANNNGDGTWVLTAGSLSPLSEGIYTVVATASLSSGVSQSTTLTNGLEIDLTPPMVSIDPLVTTDDQPDITGTHTETPVVIMVSLNGEDYEAEENGNGTWVLEGVVIEALLPGVYDVEVTTTDIAGNVGVDSTQNELTINSSEANQNGRAWLNSITAYPNPVSDIITIDAVDNGSGIARIDRIKVSVLDRRGIEVIEAYLGPESNTLDIQSLDPGIYLLRVSSLEGIKHWMLVKE
ncbi:MAG TPA: hypothetical protein DCR93_30655 [Cytophagales bacterium]|nr:hypothetical protein [Cytophagales bacterium]